jgi:hypothetical protein
MHTRRIFSLVLAGMVGAFQPSLRGNSGPQKQSGSSLAQYNCCMTPKEMPADRTYCANTIRLNRDMLQAMRNHAMSETKGA